MSNDRLNVKVVSTQNSVEINKSDNRVIVTDKTKDTSVNVIQKETHVVTVTSKGPKGDRGDTGLQIFENVDGGDRFQTVDAVGHLDVLAEFKVDGNTTITGSLVVTNNIIAPSFTGSLFGTASYSLFTENVDGGFF